MKPRPTASKSKREDVSARKADETKASASEVPTRTIFVKDSGQSIEGFVTYKEADVERRKFGKDSDERRTRVRFRNRTGKWDLLVKVARIIPDTAQQIRPRSRTAQ